MKTAVGYLRTNLTDESKVHQMYDQRDTIEQFCKEKNLECIEYFLDFGSAATFDRARFQQMLQKIETGVIKPDVTLISTWDRFSRNITGALEMLKKIRAVNVEVKSLQDFERKDFEIAIKHALTKKK